MASGKQVIENNGFRVLIKMNFSSFLAIFSCWENIKLDFSGNKKFFLGNLRH